jgi:hypothetical protein
MAFNVNDELSAFNSFKKKEWYRDYIVAGKK